MSLGIQPLCDLCQDSGCINAIDYKMLCSCPAGKELEAQIIAGREKDVHSWWGLLRQSFLLREAEHYMFDPEREVVYIQFALCYSVYSQSAMSALGARLSLPTIKKELERSSAYLRADSLAKRRMAANLNPTSVMAFDWTMIDFIKPNQSKP